MNSTLTSILTVLGGILAGVGTVLAVLYTRARNSRDDLRAAVRDEEALKSIADGALQQAQAAGTAVTGLRSEVAGLRDMVNAQGSRTSILESKMDVFWRSVAFDVSKILHSPHPGWEELDALLEKFRAQAIDPREMTALEGHLRDMVEGQWDVSEVSRADQVAASLLLRAIEQTRV